jgi:predicted nucleic acid-binding protein
MPYLIDTDWMIDRLDDVPEAAALLDTLSSEGIAVSIITYLELYQGVLRSEDRRDSERHLDALLDAIPLLPLSRSVARRCASVRHALKQTGKRVNSRAFDLIIAATAIEHGLTLVTRNLPDYTDIPELQIYRPTSP